MVDQKNALGAADAAATGAPETVELKRVNTPPAQTWNRLRANDITLTVPKISRKGDVYFALPRLFDKVECGIGQQVTDWVCSQAADSRYVEVARGEKRAEPIVITVGADDGEVADTGVMVRDDAECTIVVASLGAGEAGTSASLLRVIAGARAHVSIVEVLGCSEGQQHLDSVGITAGDDARVEVRQYALGGGTLALGSAIAQGLLRQGVAFCAALPTAEGLELCEIRTQSDFARCMDWWLSYPIPENPGASLQAFLAQHWEGYFTRLLLLTAGPCDLDLTGLDGRIGMTVVSAVNVSAPATAEMSPTTTMVELPTHPDRQEAWRVVC